MAGPFLGVELPDKFETNSSDSAPEVSSASDATDKAPEETLDTPDKPESSEVDKPAQAVKPELLELDKHERVRFKGKEWSTKDLFESYLRHEDYTRKVQLANEERKFAQNFEADLQSVVENPALLSEMKKIYPARYVRVAEKVLGNLKTQGTEKAEIAQASDAPQVLKQLDPETQSKLDQLLDFQRSVEERVKEANVAQASAQIESWFDEYAKKYPSADTRWVNFEVAQAAENYEQGGKTLSTEAAKALVEKAFKADHESREKQFSERVRSLNQAQKAAGKKAQDMGSGGGVPTAPSKKPKSFKEARNLIEADLEAGRLS